MLETQRSRRRRQRARFTPEIHREIKALYRLDNFHGPLALLEDAAVIGVGIAAFQISHWLLPLSLLLIGTRQRALATLLHEASHLTLSKSRLLNLALGTVFSGWLIFQTFHTYQQSHVREHHPLLGDEHRDPDTANYVAQNLFEQRSSSFIWAHLLKLLAGTGAPANVLYLVRHRLWPRSAKLSSAATCEYLGFVGFWAAAITLFAMTGTLAEFALLWILPYLTVFQAVNWVIELAEHFPRTRTAPDELRLSRNRFGNVVERFLTGMHAESWHLVHHLLPGVPFWNQRKVHRILLTDHAYAAVHAEAAGLFTRGANGAPCIVAAIHNELAQLHEGQPTHTEGVAL